MQGIPELDIVSGSGVGRGTPDFTVLSERSNYRRDSQSTVAGPPSCASVALRRRLGRGSLTTVFVRDCIYVKCLLHSKHGTLNQCRFNAGLPSSTSAQH